MLKKYKEKEYILSAINEDETLELLDEVDEDSFVLDIVTEDGMVKRPKELTDI